MRTVWTYAVSGYWIGKRYAFGFDGGSNGAPRAAT
jgi:hypothetical protein